MATKKKEKDFSLPNPRKEDGKYNPTAARERTTQIVDFLKNVMKIQAKLASLPRGSVLLWVVDGTPIIVNSSTLKDMANQLVSDIRGLQYYYRPPRLIEGTRARAVSIITGDGLMKFYKAAARESGRFKDLWDGLSNNLRKGGIAYTETLSSLLDYYAMVRPKIKSTKPKGYIIPNETMISTLGEIDAANRYIDGKIAHGAGNKPTLKEITDRRAESNKEAGANREWILILIYRVSIVALNVDKAEEGTREELKESLDSDYKAVKEKTNEGKQERTTKGRAEILRDYFREQEKKKKRKSKKK